MVAMVVQIQMPIGFLVLGYPTLGTLAYTNSALPLRSRPCCVTCSYHILEVLSLRSPIRSPGKLQPGHNFISKPLIGPLVELARLYLGCNYSYGLLIATLDLQEYIP